MSRFPLIMLLEAWQAWSSDLEATWWLQFQCCLVHVVSQWSWHAVVGLPPPEVFVSSSCQEHWHGCGSLHPVALLNMWILPSSFIAEDLPLLECSYANKPFGYFVTVFCRDNYNPSPWWYRWSQVSSERCRSPGLIDPRVLPQERWLNNEPFFGMFPSISST